MDNFQRKNSKSNAHVGRRFEEHAKRVFESQGIKLEGDFHLFIGIDKNKKEHAFDLGSNSPAIIVECKSHKWTSGNNVPSAKITVWNEAMYYFHLAPKRFKKILFVLRHYNPKKKETLAEYYIRTYSHLIPGGTEIWECQEKTKKVKVVRIK